MWSQILTKLGLVIWAVSGIIQCWVVISFFNSNLQFLGFLRFGNQRTSDSGIFKNLSQRTRSFHGITSKGLAV